MSSVLYIPLRIMYCGYKVFTSKDECSWKDAWGKAKDMGYANITDLDYGYSIWNVYFQFSSLLTIAVWDAFMMMSLLLNWEMFHFLMRKYLLHLFFLFIIIDLVILYFVYTCTNDLGGHIKLYGQRCSKTKRKWHARSIAFILIIICSWVLLYDVICLNDKVSSYQAIEIFFNNLLSKLKP